jgi:hypothetical protein
LTFHSKGARDKVQRERRLGIEPDREPQPRRVPLASIKPPGRARGLVKDHSGKATVPRTSGFRRAWTESPRYGGVILYVEDNNGQMWSLYDQSDEADADGWEDNADEYWSCIETQGWSLESEPVTWLQVAKSNQEVADADLEGLADLTARELDFAGDTEPEAFLADVEEILQDQTPALKASEYDAVHDRFIALLERRGLKWKPVEDDDASDGAAGGGEA